jgi:hypothetical protein
MPPKKRQLTFWQYQLIGWTSFTIVVLARNYISNYGLSWFSGVNYREFQIIVCWEISKGIISFTMTLLMWPFYRRVYRQQKSIFSMLAISGFISLFFAFIWSVIIICLHPLFPSENNPHSTGLLFACSLTLWQAPIFLGWSWFYFGIKFWKDWNIEHFRAEKANLLAQSAQLQMLRYQLNPHFLFNSLNSIRAMVEEDKQTTRDMLTELAEFLRYSLLSKNYSDVPLKEELNAIRHYFAIEKHRFEDDLEITYDIDAGAEEFPVLSFLIHPLVENAVKHGMQTSKMPLKINISARLLNGTLTIKVSNTGKWIEKTIDGHDNGTGTGLSNIRARLEQAFPGRYRFGIGPDGEWVTATIEIHQKPV